MKEKMVRTGFNGLRMDFCGGFVMNTVANCRNP